MSSTSKKILITGAGGYIGSITADLLLQNGYEILAIDNFSRGYRAPLDYLLNKYGSEKLTWKEFDLFTEDIESVIKDQNIDAIIHFAALANVGESWNQPDIYFNNNVIGTQRLAQAVINTGIKNFVFSSSCSVYGDAQYSPMDEKHPLADPASPYGATKKICEEILSWYSKTDKLKTIFLRYFNVTGASDDHQLGDSKKPSFHLIQNAVRGALGLGTFELNYADVKTPDGSPIRDYVNVVDLAEAHMKAIEYLFKPESVSNQFNIGTGQGNSVLEIIKIVKDKTGKDFKTGTAANRRQGEADKMIADITKAKEVLGWEPKHTLDQSIESLIEWYNQKPKGWEK